MIDGVTGDPASCSQLGGTLRSQAARLLPWRDELRERLTDTERVAGGTPVLVDLAADLVLIETLVDHLDAAGAVLQGYAQELAELGESIRRLGYAADQAGLVLDGLRVVEPWGILTTELAERRHRAQPTLQLQADRLASRLGRARGGTVRAMTDAADALSRAASASRQRTR